jgi:hypothetical protein
MNIFRIKKCSVKKVQNMEKAQNGKIFHFQKVIHIF